MVAMEKKNWKSAEQGRGWSGVEVKLSSRLGLEISSVAVISSTRSANRDLIMRYEKHIVDGGNLKHNKDLVRPVILDTIYHETLLYGWACHHQAPPLP